MFAMSSRHALALLGIVAVAGTGLTLATAQGNGPGPITLHEDIRVPESQRAHTSERLDRGVPIVGPKPAARQNPTAIASQGKLLPEPSRDAKTQPGEPIMGEGGFGAKRQTETKADYATGADSELHYIEVFNPSIVPFKRMSAFDGVRSDFTLVSSNPESLSDVPVGGEPSAGYDVFWASVTVQLSPGQDVPIPSVAPNIHILSYESTPGTNLIFSKDSSDNYFVRSDETGSSGTYRVVFLSEAPARYFAPKIPTSMRIRDIPKGVVPEVPEAVATVAKEVLSEMRLHRDMPVEEVLDKLVFYFRSFDAKASPPKTGNVYLDLINSQAGVCRHRSYAFMITANTLGLPTRYLSNEAHAWVEVWLPGAEWMRIDLGGAASTLNVSNAADKAMYRPRGEDPFAKPKTYEENYTKLEGDVRGLRDDQIAERQEPYTGSGGEGSGGQGGGSEGNGNFFGEGDEALTSDSGDNGPLTGPGSRLPVESDELQEGKILTRSAITAVESQGYRGETIDVSAFISEADGTGLAGAPINVFLAPAGNEGNDSFVVGRGVSDDTGAATISVEIPSDLKTQRYEVFVSFPGNKNYRSSVNQ